MGSKATDMAQRPANGVHMTSTPKKALTQLTGAAGEAMAQVHLLMRGWIAGNINGSVRNNAGFDLTATKAGRTVTIAVKAVGRGQHNVHWAGPKDQTTSMTTLFKGNSRPDVMVLIWFIGTETDPVTHRAFVVPTDVVDRDVLEVHRHWLSFPKLDGTPRIDSGHISVGLKGANSATNLTNVFAERWAEYEGERGWELLEQAAIPVLA